MAIFAACGILRNGSQVSDTLFMFSLRLHFLWAQAGFSIGVIIHGLGICQGVVKLTRAVIRPHAMRACLIVPYKPSIHQGRMRSRH